MPANASHAKGGSGSIPRQDVTNCVTIRAAMPRIAIVGAGLSGLATAHYLRRGLAEARRTADIVILESDDIPGGKMRTIREDGFAIEWGPNGFLTNKPFGIDLATELGLEARLARSSDLARRRFVFAGGRLHRLPESPGSFLGSGLMSLGGKLRLLREPWAASAPDGVDESLGDFARRRLGPEALERLIDPMVTGIYSGDPDTMSLRAAFPRIHELEAEHGGLFRGMMAVRRQRKAEGAGGKVSAGPGGVLYSFDHGVSVLADSLAEAAGSSLELGSPVDRVERRAAGYSLSVGGRGGRRQLEADVVVVAAPAYAASPMLAAVDGALADELAGIPYAPITVAAVGFDKVSLGNPLQGFGYLIPGAERRRILGVLWDSSVFPNRAPEGRALIRVMVGGVRAPALAGLPERELLGVVRDELAVTMGVSTEIEPVLAHAYLHERGIPQYLVGHPARMARIDERLATLPGLHLNCNAYRGIALNDCVLQSRLVAERIALALRP
jgi:oxygen-dependent protoporphyrinogen oxidase